MNERQYLKKKRQLELADAAMRLQQQFNPEQEARERLATEQARAAYYANEAFRQEQPLRMQQLQSDAKNYDARQALLASQLALQNAGAGQDIAMGNATFNPRVRSATEAARQMSLQNTAQQFQNDRLENTQQIFVDQQRAEKDRLAAGALAAQTEAKYGVRTLEDRVSEAQTAAFYAKQRALQQQAETDVSRQTVIPRVAVAMEQPHLTREQLNEAKIRNTGLNQQVQQSAQLFPSQQARAEAEAIQAMRLAGTGLGTPVEVIGKDGKPMMTPTDIDPRAMLSRPGYQQMQRMLENGAAGQAPGAVPPDVQRTFTELSNPDLRARLFEAVPQNRKFTTTPEPGTVQLGQEFARAYEVMDQAPLANWPIEGQALQLIRQNPEKFGMYRFDPALISAEDFAQALEMVRPANYTEQPLLPPPAVSIYPKWMGLTPQYTR